MDDDKIDNLTAPFDIHQATASEMFGVPPEQVTEEMRKAAKRRNFGKLYGMSREALERPGAVDEFIKNTF